MIQDSFVFILVFNQYTRVLVSFLLRSRTETRTSATVSTHWYKYEPYIERWSLFLSPLPLERGKGSGVCVCLLKT